MMQSGLILWENGRVALRSWHKESASENNKFNGKSKVEQEFQSLGLTDGEIRMVLQDYEKQTWHIDLNHEAYKNFGKKGLRLSFCSLQQQQEWSSEWNNLFHWACFHKFST